MCRRAEFRLQIYADHGPIRVVQFEQTGYFADLADIVGRDGYILVDADMAHSRYFYGHKQWPGLRAEIVRKSYLKLEEMRNGSINEGN